MVTGFFVLCHTDICFVSGPDIHVLKYSNSVEIVAGYPKPLSEELGVTPVPSSVNAADVSADTLYILDGNMACAYQISGNVPSFSYAFIK